MTQYTRRLIGRCAALAAVLGLAALDGRDWPAQAAEKAESVISSWPDLSRRTAEMMIEEHGKPHKIEADSLTWHGLYRGRKTVVHRANPEGVVEQTVNYRVPEKKVGEVERIDDRLKVDRGASELTAVSDSLRTDFLLLNLAHEVASGFRSVEGARAFRDKEQRLAASGKDSRYRGELLFEREIPITIHPDGKLPPYETPPTPPVPQTPSTEPIVP